MTSVPCTVRTRGDAAPVADVLLRVCVRTCAVADLGGRGNENLMKNNTIKIVRVTLIIYLCIR